MNDRIGVNEKWDGVLSGQMYIERVMNVYSYMINIWMHICENMCESMNIQIDW